MPTIINGTTGVDQIQDGSVTAADLASASVTPSKLSQPLTLGTAVVTTSGTAIDFTGIPSWVKRITLMFNGVTTNSTSNWLVQLGSGSFQTTGYLSTNSSGGTGVASTSTVNGHFVAGQVASGAFFSGQAVFTHMGANIWVASSTLTSLNAFYIASTSVGLSGVLDRIRLTTANGTDTFDGGSVNILYEG